MTALRPFLSVLVFLAGCGGRLAMPDEAATSPPSATEDPPTSSPMPWVAAATSPVQTALPEDGEWGTWQLLSVDRPEGGRDYRPPYVEIDLHSTGGAYLWHCSAEPTGTGQRCPYGARFGCVVGTISVSGMDWYVEFPGARPSLALIEEEPSGDIFLNGSEMIPSGGHYRRVAAASNDRCRP